MSFARPDEGASEFSDDDAAWAAALAALGTSPGGLRRLLAGRAPRAAWEAVVAGSHPADPKRRNHAAARPGLPEELAERCRLARIEVMTLGSPRYPVRLARDPEAPAVLFARGDPTVGTGRPSVAVVGTRSATSAGRDRAFEIGAALTEAGAVVVSGLASGIDLCALCGALTHEAAAALAVLGSPHDAFVRSDQRRVADVMARHGAVLSELPPGAPGARWRFAVRNRVLVALADLVVVVECHERGGALHTVRYARRRGVPVAVVPGSTASSASDGTNALLVSGAAAVRSGSDTVDLLETVTGWHPVRLSGAAGRLPNRTSQPPLDLVATSVLDALDADPVTLDAIVLRAGASLAAAAVALEELGRRGLARGEGGFWWRLRPPVPSRLRPGPSGRAREDRADREAEDGGEPTCATW